MNGAQDMGGMHGFGPVVAEADEPPFHAAWERRVFAVTLAMGATGEWNLDMSRAARESLPPQSYLAKSYYEIWLAGLETLLAERGLASRQEIESGTPAGTAKPVARKLDAAQVASSLARGSSTKRDTNQAPRFAPGDRVRARTMNPETHTRLPRYVRGHPGTVRIVHGAFVLPDSNALGHGEAPEHCYAVEFAARELWGGDADANHTVSVDLWESYLEPA